MKNNYRLLFVHGWGYSSSFWQKLQNNLKEYHSETIDLGFIGKNTDKNCNLKSILNLQEKYIAVGHSLGFLYLLKNFSFRFKYYVAINSFARFSRDPTFPKGVASRVLDRMSRGLSTDSNLIMKQFYQQCGQVVNFLPSFNIEELQKGLEFLKFGDVRSIIPQIRNKLTVIASKKDPVVNETMTIQSFQECNYLWLDDDTHILPLSKTNACAEIIRELINNV